MCIDLGGVDGCMTEELLDRAYIGAVVEKVRRKDVAEYVRGDFLRDTGL